MIREKFEAYIHELQNRICDSLEAVDGKAKFKEDRWQRDGGGGGITRVIANGDVFEKGGVNTSVVHGKLNAMAQKQLKVEHEDFFACGISLVIHPFSPKVPTVHMNVRTFELYDENQNVVNGWFGGGIDLTPYYFWEEDAIHFHQVLKEACDPFGSELYPDFKKQCDEYFYNSHRKEARGIGGIFFDYLKAKDQYSFEDRYNFTRSVGDAFLPSYIDIVNRRKMETWTESEKEWQEIRRGRYVEFNLLHDRGTHFGIKTNGRTESILMSLPPTVRWEYDHHPESGSKEEELLLKLKPQDWAEMKLEV